MPSTNLEPVCNREMTAVLSALSHSKARISEFCVGAMSWECLLQTPEQLMKLAKPLSHLLSFHIRIGCNGDTSLDGMWSSLCQHILATNQFLVVMLGQIPNLESL